MHDPKYQNLKNKGSIVYMASRRVVYNPQHNGHVKDGHRTAHCGTCVLAPIATKTAERSLDPCPEIAQPLSPGPSWSEKAESTNQWVNINKYLSE